MGTAVKHPVPDRVKPSFVTFDIRALCRSVLSVRVPGCQNLQMTAWPGLAGVGCFIAVPMWQQWTDVKGLMICSQWFSWTVLRLSTGCSLPWSVRCSCGRVAVCRPTPSQTRTLRWLWTAGELVQTSPAGSATRQERSVCSLHSTHCVLRCSGA